MLKSAFRNESSAKKRPTYVRKLIHWTEVSSNDDMDICSDSDISLDSDSPSPIPSPPQATILHYQPTGTDVDQEKTTHRAHPRVERFSPFDSLPQKERSVYHPNPYPTEFHTPPSSPRGKTRREKHTSSKPRKNTFKPVRDSQFDDPIVLTNWLRCSASGSLICPEIATDTRIHGSANSSDITDSTLAGMPSFPPRDTLLDDFIEEWSLPDEETNDVLFFSLQGKQYIHDPLPPGWVMRVSKTRNRPFYVHPDHGITWHCPVVLKPRSEALVLRRSSLETKKQQAKRARATGHVIAVSPTPHPFSLEGSMSELIQHYNDPQIMEGYDGSVSSTSTTDSDRTSTAASSLTGGHDEDPFLSGHQDWVTPLRLGIATPSLLSRQRRTPTVQFSNRKLSPIDEIAKVNLTPSSSQRKAQYHTTNYFIKEHITWDLSMAQNIITANEANGMSSTDLVHPTPREERSTPRVSFEPMEVTCREESIQDANNGSGQKTSGAGQASIRKAHSAPNPKSPVQFRLVNHASTPISDTDDTMDAWKTGRCSETIVVESICHSLPFRSCYNPMTPPVQVTSTLRHAAMKGEGISLSDSRALGEILQNSPWQPPLNTDENGEALMIVDAHHNKKVDKHDDSCQSHLHLPTRGTPCQQASAQGDDEDFNHPSRKKTDEIPLSEQNKPSDPKTPASFTLDQHNATTDSMDRDDAYTPNDYCTPSQSLGESNNDSTAILSLRSNSTSRCDRQLSSPSNSTVRSPLSINIPVSSPEKSFEGLPKDDHESEVSIPDIKIKTKYRPFNWRVLHPMYPLCSLQRLDDLLRQQRQGTRHATNARRNRAQRIRDSKKKNPRVRQKQKAKARLMF